MRSVQWTFVVSTIRIHPYLTQLNAHETTGDTVTTPTVSMMQAMTSSAIGDDVYNEDETTISLEQHVASLLGHEAALFVPSGTAGNQIALRVHLTQPPHCELDLTPYESYLTLLGYLSRTVSRSFAYQSV
jgi:hypothetical protein